MGCTMTTQNGLLMQQDESTTRVFKVTNVDNNGEDRNPGYIEITTDSLVLHQRGKESIAWPLHGLRRYGFDADLFSFESGRRCPTGPGIYAFRCRHAEALFNLLQSSIVVAGQSNAAAHRTGGGLVESARRRTTVHAGSTVQPSNQLTFFQPVAVVRPLRPQLALSHYRNIPVNGHTVGHSEHVERQSLAQLPDILAMYQQHQPDPPVHYAELDLGQHVDDEVSVDEDDVEVFVADERSSSGNQTDPQLYVNMASGTCRPAVSNTVRHGYANLDLIADSAAAGTGVDASISKMNYIQLDLSSETLDAAGECSPTVTSPATTRTMSLTQQASITHATGDSYTTIDFDRTRALNTISVEPSGIADEGVRRTRHNSNII